MTSDCTICPESARCAGGAHMIAKQGFWRFDNSSNEFFPCPWSEACMGAPADTETPLDYDEGCSTGFYGKLCASCEYGYSYVGAKKECVACNSQLERWTGFVTIFVALCLLLTYIVQSTLKSAKEEASVEGNMIKILVSHFQVVSLAAKFELDWGPIMDQLFSLMSIFSSISEDIPAIDCEITEYSSFEGTPLIYRKIMVFAAAPFIFIPIMYLFLKLMGCCCKSKNRSNLVFSVSSLVFVYLTQSSLAKQG